MRALTSFERFQRACFLWFRIALACAIAGCDLHVNTPDIVQPNQLDNPPGALIRRNGAIASFAAAVAQQAYASGVLVDEFTDRTGTILADQRRIDPTQDQTYPYDLIGSTRIAILRAIASLQQYNPLPRWHLGEQFALLGYTEIMLAENMCSGIPLGILQSGLPAYGPTLSHDQMLQRALTDFDSAGAYLSVSSSGSPDAAASDSIASLVRIGRARALLDQANFAAAGAAVDSVPDSYLYEPPFSATPGAFQSNAVFNNIVLNLFISVSDNEGTNGLDFISAGDPRVPTDSVGVGPDGGAIYNFATYSSVTSPIQLASGVEARLIQAESALQAGQTALWASALNTLRATAISPAMDSLSSDSTGGASTDEQVNTMFRERAFWLFASGHRHGDLRRLIRQYHRATEQTFPTGVYPATGGQYGTGVAWQPDNEQTNPNFHGCLNIGP